jgi:cytochrome oxidase assembly protein ShyY1
MLGLHLLAIAAIAAMVVAGGWQFDTYGDARRDDTVAVISGPVVPLSQVLGPDDPLTDAALDTRVVAEGTYAGQQFLVRDREDAGKSGYWVLTPLLVSGDTAAGAEPSAALLVVRGWQASATAPPASAGEVRVTGVLEPGEEAPTTVDAERVIDSVRIPTLLNAVDFDLYSGYLLRTSEEPPVEDGLRPVTPQTPEGSWTTGLRNLAYAMQWWVFAAFGVYMWWRICGEEVARHTTTPSSARPAPVG